MRVLVIASGNKFSGISNIIRAQVRSLENEGLHIDLFAVQGKGAFNYFKSILRLRKVLMKKQYCVVHAHYSFSTWVALLAGSKNVVCSLMGSDVKSNRFLKFLIRYFLIPFCKVVIVKSNEMKMNLGYSKALVIPNGVNDELFFPIDKLTAQNALNWDSRKLNILFPSDPLRKEKNYALLMEALSKLKDVNFEVHILKEIAMQDLNLHYNAADLVCLTSKREGSPNAVKEAMACGKLVVSTQVGDVSWLFEDGKGLFLAEQNADSFARSISAALEFGKLNEMRSNGRERLLKLGISSSLIARELIRIYDELCLLEIGSDSTL